MLRVTGTRVPMETDGAHEDDDAHTKRLPPVALDPRPLPPSPLAGKVAKE